MTCRQKFSFFGILNACMSKIAYKSFENTKHENFLTKSHRKVAQKCFQGLRMYHIVHNLDGTEQGYQSHQLRTKSDV